MSSTFPMQVLSGTCHFLDGSTCVRRPSPTRLLTADPYTLSQNPTRRMMRNTVRLVLLSGVVACRDVGSPPGPAHIEIVQAPPALGVPNARLVDTIRVRLVDGDGNPRGGQPLTWVIRQGGGGVEPLNDTTTSEGIVSARWTLGPGEGPNELEVKSLDDSSLTFHVDGEAFRLDRVDSDYQLACGIREGNLWCWGLFSPATTPPVSEVPANPFGDVYPAPGQVAPGTRFTDLAVSGTGVCAIDVGQVVHCYDVLGNIASAPQVPALLQVTGAFYRFCGIASADTTAWCWDAFTGSATQVSPSFSFLEVKMDDGNGRILSPAEDWSIRALRAGAMARRSETVRRNPPMSPCW